MGIGLAIARSMIEAHAGRRGAEAHAAVGQPCGSACRCLQARDPEVDPGSNPAPAPSPPPATANSDQSAIVLAPVHPYAARVECAF
jgi:hypothetical protein